MTAQLTAEIVHDMPDAEYHARPELSSTGARKLLESPARFHYWRLHPSTPTDAMELGTAVHAKVLGTSSPVVRLDFENYRTAKAQAARDEARAGGKIPMLNGSKDLNVIDAMSESVLAHPEARCILETATGREESLFATDPGTGVDMRARFDVWGDDECADLKTTTDASPRNFTKSIWNFRYDVQQEHYLKVRELVTGDRPRFRFIAVETSAPYLVAVHEIDEQWQEIGDVWATAARKLFRACTDADLWPGYGSETHVLMPPVGLIYEHQDRFESRDMEVA